MNKKQKLAVTAAFSTLFFCANATKNFEKEYIWTQKQATQKIQKLVKPRFATENEQTWEYSDKQSEIDAKQLERALIKTVILDRTCYFIIDTQARWHPDKTVSCLKKHLPEIFERFIVDRVNEIDATFSAEAEFIAQDLVKKIDDWSALHDFIGNALVEKIEPIMEEMRQEVQAYI